MLGTVTMKRLIMYVYKGYIVKFDSLISNNTLYGFVKCRHFDNCWPEPIPIKTFLKKSLSQLLEFNLALQLPIYSFHHN